jgi:hypothetical protein
MANSTDLTDLDPQSYRRHLVDTFGEDVLTGLATDEAKANTTAAKIVQRKEAREAEARHQRGVEQLKVSAQMQKDEAAFDQAMKFISAGQDVPAPLVEAALRHQRLQGGASGLSSSEIIGLRARRTRS